MPKNAPETVDSLGALAANLKALRTRNNWSTRELAVHAKIGRATVQRIEGLQFTTVTVATIDRLARGLGVRTGSLLTRRPLSRRPDEPLVEEALAENLAQLRHVRELTQEALGQRSGVSMFAIAHIERKARSPDLATLDRLAEALRVSPARLLA